MKLICNFAGNNFVHYCTLVTVHVPVKGSLFLFVNLCEFFCYPSHFILMYFHTFFSLYTVAEPMIIYISIDNGDMSSPKHHVFIMLHFILKCFSKAHVIRSKFGQCMVILSWHYVQLQVGRIVSLCISSSLSYSISVCDTYSLLGCCLFRWLQILSFQL